MPNIYVTDETKELIETTSNSDCRTMDGEINFLCKQRVKELGLPDVSSPSVCNGNDSKSRGDCQENSQKGA